MNVAPEHPLTGLLVDTRINALLGWMVVAAMLLVWIRHVVRGEVLWAVTIAALLGVTLVPPLATRTPIVMVPWELIGMAAVPSILQLLHLPATVDTLVSFLAIAVLALIVTAQLHVFTTLTVTHWFTVTFVSMATVGAAGGWAILRWVLDQYAGTSFLTTNSELMVEFALATVAGIVAGIGFDLYFRPRVQRLRRQLREVLPQ